MIHFDTQSRFVHSSILDKPRKSLFSSHKSSTTSLCLCEPYYSLLIWFLYYSDCRNNSCTHLNPVVQRSAVKIKFVKGKMVVNTLEDLLLFDRNIFFFEWTQSDTPKQPFLKAPSMSFYPDFISILSWFYPDSILILSKFYPDKIRIKFG